MNVKVLYKSDDYLIVDKPPDLLINSDDENEKNTLHRILLRLDLFGRGTEDEQVPRPLKHGFHFVHRLDKATSGVICLAVNKTAAAKAGKLFESRKVDKYYLAILHGHLRDEVTTIDIAVGYSEANLQGNKMMCCAGPADCLRPRSASSRLLVLETGLYEGKIATKALMKPLTGRRHQLRVHAAFIGHTIVGDYTYSGRTDVAPPRMFLHAFRLVIPLLQEPIDVQTDEPFKLSDQQWTSLNMYNDICLNGGRDVFEKIDIGDRSVFVKM